jgi:putative transposase
MNASATFQSLINYLLGHLSLVSVYLEDILVFSMTKSENEQHLNQILKDIHLHAKSFKCPFFQEHIKFLDHILTLDRVSPSPSKLEAIETWPSPKNVKALQSFLGFVNYYRRFIPKFLCLEPIAANLYWARMTHDIETYVSACDL